MHWHTEANPCLLCGVPVTPESWDGGVIEDTGADTGDSPQWGKSGEAGEVGHFDNEPRIEFWDEVIGWSCPRIAATRPIFPPRGWAGKSDAELWDAVFNPDTWPMRIAHGYSWELAFDIRWREKYPLRLCCGTIERGDEYHDCAVDYEELRDPAALILALQNAQVLAARLTEAQ